MMPNRGQFKYIMSWKDLIDGKSALATALDIVGDRWSLMILSGSFYSAHRFNDLERALGINRNLLSQRLTRLTEKGLLVRRKYQSKPDRYEYHPTEIGLALRPVIVALARWGREHYTKDDSAVILVHSTCGGHLRSDVICDKCDAIVPVSDIQTHFQSDLGEHIRPSYLQSLEGVKQETP